MLDVVIVGSGPVGAAYARTILDLRPETSILMIEAGPLITDPPGSHIKNIADDDARDRALYLAQGPSRPHDEPVTVPERALAAGDVAAEDKYFRRAGLYLVDGERRTAPGDGLPAASATSCVGGMGTQWTAACPRPQGSEVIPFIEGPALEAAFGRAEELLRVSDREIGAGTDEAILKTLSQLFDQGREESKTVRRMPLAVTRDSAGRRQWSGADTVLGDALSFKNFSLRPNTRCTRVLMEEILAVGVELENQTTGRRYEEPARYVVLAAGSIHTPQLLFASGIRPQALGRYLNDHHMIVGAVSVPAPAGEHPSLATERTSIDSVTGVTWIPADDQTLPLHGQIMHTDAATIALQEGESQDEQVVSLGWFAAKDIQETDRVEFTDERTDNSGMPGFSIHYTLTKKDHELISLAKEKTALVSNRLGRPVYPEPAYVLPPGFSLHYQGTVRMGADNDGTSVCDQYGSPWDTENLFLGGNGVIPTATACNPTLTSVALAIHGARKICQQLARAGLKE